MRYHLYIMCFYQIADFFSIGIDLLSIADFHADFYYLFQIVERTWTPPSTEGDKNKSRKRLHLRCRIGTFLFCFPCIETSTAAASSSYARACLPPARPSCSLQKFYSKVFAGVATLLLSQPCLIRLGSLSMLHKLAGLNSLHLPHQVRQAYHGRQP